MTEKRIDDMTINELKNRLRSIWKNDDKPYSEQDIYMRYWSRSDQEKILKRIEELQMRKEILGEINNDIKVQVVNPLIVEKRKAKKIKSIETPEKDSDGPFDNFSNYIFKDMSFDKTKDGNVGTPEDWKKEVEEEIEIEKRRKEAFEKMKKEIEKKKNTEEFLGKWSDDILNICNRKKGEV